MAQCLDVYLSKYPAQYINCMTSDSEFVAFVKHAIQLALDLTTYPNIWAVLCWKHKMAMHPTYRQYMITTINAMILELKNIWYFLKKQQNNHFSMCTAVSVQFTNLQLSDQYDANAENCTQLPYHAHFNDILTEYPAWSVDANDIENTYQAQYRSYRQDILTAWQKDTPIKMPDNRQVLDNLEAYVQDKLSITRSLHDRLGLTENSLPGAQTVTVAMVQSDQLTTRIPNNSPNNTEIGQQDDNDYPGNREEYLYQVDGTTDIYTPTDHSADDEDTEPDNSTCKRQRRVYVPADTNRKELTKQRQT